MTWLETFVYLSPVILALIWLGADAVEQIRKLQAFLKRDRVL